MEEEVGMQQQLQHEVAQKAAVEMTQSMAVHQAVQQDAIESRSALQAACTGAGQRLTAAAEDLSAEYGDDVSEAAEAWLDEAQESLQAAQDSAAAFFEKVDEQVDAGDDNLRQQLLEISDQAAQALQDFAVQVDQQGRELEETVSTLFAEDNTADLDEAFTAAAERTAALQNELNATMDQLAQQVPSALVDSERLKPFQGSEFTSQEIDDLFDQVQVTGKGLQQLEPFVNVDESLAVNQNNISEAERMRRALDIEARQLLEGTLNQATKNNFVDQSAWRDAPMREPVSVRDDPACLFERRFGEIVEMREIAEKVAGPDVLARLEGKTADQVKNALNTAIRNEIKEPTTDAGRAVNAALRELLCREDNEFFRRTSKKKD
jgi:hypothetical protein